MEKFKCVKKECIEAINKDDLLFCYKHRRDWQFMCSHPLDVNDVKKIKESSGILESLRDERLKLMRTF